MRLLGKTEPPLLNFTLTDIHNVLLQNDRPEKDKRQNMRLSFAGINMINLLQMNYFKAPLKMSAP